MEAPTEKACDEGYEELLLSGMEAILYNIRPESAN